MNRGWWTITRLRGAPVRLHWTVPLGAFVMGRFSFVPAFWLGFVALVLIHELGHALLVLRYRLGLSEIAIHGLGGHCQHQRSGTRFQEAVVAWGGVLAQSALLLAAYAWTLSVGPPSSEHAALLLHVFTSTNLWLIAINLLPIAPLDGSKAWPLLGMLGERWRQRRSTEGRREPPSNPVDEQLRAIKRLPTGETPEERTDRLVRELIARTTQSKDDR